MKKLSAGLLFAAFMTGNMAASLGGAQAVTVINGSFEHGPAVAGFTTLATGSNAITGWQVASGSIDYIGNYWQAADGSRSIDLDGNAPGSIKQQLTGLVGGTQYRVAFNIAGNPDGGPAIKNLNLAVGIDNQSYSFDTTGDSRGAMGWLTAFFVFTAQGSTADLVFSSLSLGGPYGAALDNVSISETPLPAALPLFATALSGLGFFSWWKKRRMATA